MITDQPKKNEKFVHAAYLVLFIQGHFTDNISTQNAVYILYTDAHAQHNNTCKCIHANSFSFLLHPETVLSHKKV